jgi:hypothetical protein
VQERSLARGGRSYPEVDGAHDGDLRAPVSHVLEIAHGSGSLLLHLRVRLQVLHYLRCDFVHQKYVLVVQVEICLQQLRIRP